MDEIMKRWCEVWDNHTIAVIAVGCVVLAIALAAVSSLAGIPIVHTQVIPIYIQIYGGS
jgi:hypothetical protein